jgi:hypothetical protein
VPQPELFIGPDSIEVVPKVRNFRNFTPVDHYKVVYQRIYSVLRSVKPHPRYTPFGVRKNYGNVVVPTDSASRLKRVGCGILFHIGLKMSALCGIGEDALYVIVAFCGIGFFSSGIY